MGLATAIEWQADEFEKRTGIQNKITIIPKDIIVNEELSTALFRIFQEALTNVTRHAKATMVYITLKEKDGKLILRVRDNGKGIEKKKIDDPESFGLLGMRERVYPLGGKVKITGISDKGTTVVVTIPLD